MLFIQSLKILKEVNQVRKIVYVPLPTGSRISVSLETLDIAEYPALRSVRRYLIVQSNKLALTLTRRFSANNRVEERWII